MSQFTIRGITQNDFNDHVESVIAVYIDETYVASQQGQTFGLFDIDRVEALKAIGSGATDEESLAAARAVLTPEAMVEIGMPAGTPKHALLGQIGTPWFRYFLKYDPAPNLRAIRVPVLAMNGSLDRQVSAKENLPAIRAALKDDRDVTIVEIPGLNHLFQTAKTGAVGEYARIEETVSPVALEQIASWINARFGVK